MEEARAVCAVVLKAGPRPSRGRPGGHDARTFRIRESLRTGRAVMYEVNF